MVVCVKSNVQKKNFGKTTAIPLNIAFLTIFPNFSTNFRCYNSDRSLFCGVNNNFEPYVCCPPSYQPPSYQPQGSGQFDVPERLNGGCGKTLIQGSFYKKLGSNPFVARIGFKSESKPTSVGVIMS